MNQSSGKQFFVIVLQKRNCNRTDVNQCATVSDATSDNAFLGIEYAME
jgi:hypothetical protein